MIIGREELIRLEDYAKKQESIYNDACDYGFIVKTKAQNEDLTDIVNEFRKTFVHKIDNSFNSSTLSLFMPIESDEGRQGYVLGYCILISK